MHKHKYSQVISKLENSELENECEAPFYMELLTMYLCEDQLINAEFLWRRIPQRIKASNKEFEKIGSIISALKGNNYVEFFKIVDCGWSDGLQSIMKDLEDKNREKLLRLLETSYNFINEKHLINLTHLSSDELLRVCKKMGWEVKQGASDTHIEPKINNNEVSSSCNSQNELFILTEFVSFLES